MGVDFMDGHARVIANFAQVHFSAAKRFAATVAQVESAHFGEPFGEFFEEIRINCASCIIVAAASLEALINEIYIEPGPLRDAVPDFERVFWGEGKRKRCPLLFWQSRVARSIEGKSTVEKYKQALKLLEKPQLSQASTTNAWGLIAFRHYLIHFKPLWDDQLRINAQDNLQRRLQGFFEPSPFIGLDADFLATRCMSAGCANWAVNTVSSFVREFGENAGIHLQKLSAFM